MIRGMLGVSTMAHIRLGFRVLDVESGVSWKILEPLSWTLSPERPLPAGNPEP